MLIVSIFLFLIQLVDYSCVSEVHSKSTRVRCLASFCEIFILCLNSQGILSIAAGLTLLHFSGQKQGSWKLDAQTWELQPTAAHHGGSHPAEKWNRMRNRTELKRMKMRSVFCSCCSSCCCWKSTIEPKYTSWNSINCRIFLNPSTPSSSGWPMLTKKTQSFRSVA